MKASVEQAEGVKETLEKKCAGKPWFCGAGVRADAVWGVVVRIKIDMNWLDGVFSVDECLKEQRTAAGVMVRVIAGLPAKEVSYGEHEKAIDIWEVERILAKL